jgi:tRNA-dihydrouridine synthase
VMLGRGIFGNPWLFAGAHKEEQPTPPTLQERLKVLVEHTKLYEQFFAGTKPFDIMKRHFKAYIAGFDGAADLRTQLYETKSSHDVETVVEAFLQTGQS